MYHGEFVTFTTKSLAWLRRNQNQKDRIHHEGTKDTKFGV